MLQALAFEPFGFWPLAALALVPLLVVVQRATPRAALAHGMVFGLVQGALSAHWLFGIFGPPAASLLLVYAVWHALACVAIALGTRRGLPLALVAAPCWIACEHLRAGNPWLPFGWFTPGSAMVHDGWLLQWASAIGERGLTGIVVTGNALLARAWCARPAHVVVAAWLAIAVLLHAAGFLTLREERGTLHVGVVEGEGLGVAHWRRGVADLLAAHPETELVVLPEYATFARIHPESPDLVSFAEIARTHGVPLVFGGTEATARGFANTLFFLDRKGEVVHRQAKSVPVPLFADGEPARTREPHAGIGAAICYDMDFPFVARELVAKGAELLVFPTFDAASWGRVQHAQHAALAPLRAVENRRWLVRAASSGTSLVCDPWGRRVDGSGAFVRAVGKRTERSGFTQWGHLLPWLCLGFVAWVVASGLRGARQLRA